MRDQQRTPIAADIKRVMREKAALGQRTFALTADVSEAHRQIPIAECDWRYLGCLVKVAGAVNINKVGAFGYLHPPHVGGPVWPQRWVVSHNTW